MVFLMPNPTKKSTVSHVFKNIKVMEDPSFPFLYLPPEVDFKYIQTNGKLLTVDQIKFVRNCADPPNSDEFRRVLKKLPKNSPLHADFDVLLITDPKGDLHYYVIYFGVKKNKHLGAGSFGKVKLAQDIDTGEVVALKTSISDDNIELLQHENDLNNAAGFRGYFVKRSRAFQKKVLVTKLARGRNLNQIQNMESIRKTPWEWLEMSLGILKSSKALDEKGILNQDIKPDNFVGDLKTNQVAVVDLGLANLKTESAINDFKGTPGFMAPEIYDKKQSFDSRSAIYSLGVTLILFLRLGIFESDMGYEPPKFHPISERNSRITNVDMRSAIVKFITRMIDDNPDKRPTYDEAIDFFQHVQRLHLQALTKIKRAGLLNIDDYVTGDKKKIIEALKCCDEVFLIVPEHSIDEMSKKRPNKFYIELRRELEDAGVVVSDRLFYTPTNSQNNELDLIYSIPDYLTEKDSDILRSYFYITNKKNNVEIFKDHNEIHPILANRKRASDYQRFFKNKNSQLITYEEEMTNYYKNQNVSQRSLENVLSSLSVEQAFIDIDSSTRLGHRVETDRTNKMKKMITLIEDYKDSGDRHLSVYDLLTMLEKLQAEMQSKNIIRRVLSKFFPIFKTSEEKAVKSVIDSTKTLLVYESKFKHK